MLEKREKNGKENYQTKRLSDDHNNEGHNALKCEASAIKYLFSLLAFIAVNHISTIFSISCSIDTLLRNM